MYSRLLPYKSMLIAATSIVSGTAASYYIMNNNPTVVYSQSKLSNETIEPNFLDIDLYYKTINSPHAPGMNYFST